MINQLAWSITNLFIRNEEISDEDGEIYAFGFECLLSTAIQIAILAIVGFVFKCFLEITLYSICFTRIKGYIGGYHANTHLTCIGGYTLVALSSVYICKLSPDLLSIGFVLMAIALVYKLAPIQHYNNPKTDEEVIVARKKALLVLALISISIFIIYLSPFTEFAIYGACGLFVASSSLLIKNKELDSHITQ